MRAAGNVEDNHLGRLLADRRAHQRFSSGSDMSEVRSIDTPSVYSNAYFSPMQTSSRPDRNRLNDLAVSMLDLDDDPRSTIVSYSNNEHYNDRNDDFNDSEDQEEHLDDNSRMSMLGPKIRLHSKAPWEMDGDPLNEEDETDSILDPSRDKVSPARSTFSKHGFFGRPSSEAKRSFETSSSVSNPAQSSGQASTSLVYNNNLSASRRPFAQSLGRGSSHSPSPIPPSHLSTAHPPSLISYRLDNRERSPDRRTLRSVNDPPASFSYSEEEERHPYANPEHGVHSYDEPPRSPSTIAFPGVARNDSLATVTDSTTMSSLSSSQRDASISTPASPRSIFQGKEISSPIPVQSSAFRSTPNDKAAAWTDSSSSPAFNLISLEEARALRSRTTTAQTPNRTSGSSGASALNFPYTGDDAASAHSLNNSMTSRARARSISAGTRAKQAISNIVGAPRLEHRDSDPAVVTLQQTSNSQGGKPLRHKKSGFMRLFNGGKDDKSPPPPVPSLLDGYAAFNAQQSSQKTAKITSHRIPVPSLSPTVSEGSPSQATAKPAPSPKRTPPPPLTIGTPAIMGRASSASAPPSSFLRPDDGVPQSAPANVSEFPALKLRPISTMFSAHFGDHIISHGSSPSSDSESDTVLSSSPLTPAAPTTTSKEQDTKDSVIRQLQEQIVSSKIAWQRHIWELECQVKDLKAEVEELRAGKGSSEQYCSTCGRGDKAEVQSSLSKPPGGVVNRPRARTGTSGTNARFANSD